MWFTKFYSIRWSQKESFNKDLYTSGVFEHKFFREFERTNLQNFKCPRGVAEGDVEVSNWSTYHWLSAHSVVNKEMIQMK